MSYQAMPTVNRRLNLRAINSYLIGLSAVTLALYIFAVNSLSIQGFALADYKNQLNDLKRDNKNLEVRITTIGSYSYLTERIKKLNLVPVGEINYLNPAAVAMVVK